MRQKPHTLTIIRLILFLFFFMFHCSTGYIPQPQSEQEQAFIKLAKTFLRTPYRYGGDNRTGMDCSGLVYRLYKDFFGINLPHNTRQLYKTNQTITYRSLQVSDLIFFRENRSSLPTHVGIYLGNHNFIHASEKKGIIISSIQNTYYKRRICGFKRIKK